MPINIDRRGESPSRSLPRRRSSPSRTPQRIIPSQNYHEMNHIQDQRESFQVSKQSSQEINSRKKSQGSLLTFIVRFSLFVLLLISFFSLIRYSLIPLPKDEPLMAIDSSESVQKGIKLSEENLEEVWEFISPRLQELIEEQLSSVQEQQNSQGEQIIELKNNQHKLENRQQENRLLSSSSLFDSLRPQFNELIELKLNPIQGQLTELKNQKFDQLSLKPIIFEWVSQELQNFKKTFELPEREKFDLTSRSHSEKVIKEFQSKTLESLDSFENHLSPDVLQQMKRLISESLSLYSADRIGRLDLTSPLIGSRIETSLTSSSSSSSALSSWYYTIRPHPAYEALDSDIQPGKCWLVESSEVTLTISLAWPTKPTAVTIDHAEWSLLPNQVLRRAPRQFEIYGFESLDSEKILLGAGEYSLHPSKSNIQTFSLGVNSDGDRLPLLENEISYVQLKILSNHGDPFTCLYRFRTHSDNFDTEEKNLPFD